MKLHIGICLFIIISFFSLQVSASNTNNKFERKLHLKFLKQDSLGLKIKESKTNPIPINIRKTHSENHYKVIGILSGILAIFALIGLVIYILSIYGLWYALSPLFIIGTPISILLAIILGKYSKNKVKKKGWAKLGIILGFFDLIIGALIALLLSYLVVITGR